MLRLRQLVCSGVRSGVKGDISGVTTVGLVAQNDVRSGGQVRLRARFLLDIESYTKVQGQPLLPSEMEQAMLERL